MTNTKKSNSSSFNPILLVVIGILVILLMGSSFAIGVLWFKNGNGSSFGKKDNDSATNVGSAPSEGYEVSDLPAIAKKIGLNVDEFQTCLDNNDTAETVQNSYQGGLQAGINGTPGTIALNTETGEAKLITGALPYANIKQILDALLGKGDTAVLDTVTDVTSFEPLSDTDHRRGAKDAKIVLIEYSDFECPFCQRFHPTMLQVLNDYSDDVAWVYRHFPLDSLHPKARPFAHASECAYNQGGNDAFWKMADIFFE